MKYIKLFETNKVNFGDLKKGDYVLIEWDRKGMTKIIKILDSVEKELDGYKFIGLVIDYPGELQGTFYDNDIIKKLNPDEVELLINTNKYNL